MTGPPLLQAAHRLRAAVQKLRFSPPVAHVYNPLDYAWEAHAAYLRRYGKGPKRVVFLGMNPGPFGMMQTGVPFGEVGAVRNWLGVEALVRRPTKEHNKRPILGFACARSEVSGRRLWGLFRGRFGTADRFFSEHIVLNYCPLVFLEPNGRNRTPDKLRARESAPLVTACDDHLRAVVKILKPEWVLGIGNFAAQQAGRVLAGSKVKAGRILHPSPANPAANRDWSGRATAQLRKLGVWD